MWRSEMDLFLYSLDAAWGAMWLMQFVVQVLLPLEHRAFKLSRVANVVLVYALKFIITLVCGYYAYEKCVADPDTSCDLPPIPPVDEQLKIPYKTILRINKEPSVRS